MTKPFFYDLDFRRDPKDASKPYCMRCQQNVDINKAVPVSVNEETWMAIKGHDLHEEIRTNFAPQCRDLVSNQYIGKDCMERELEDDYPVHHTTCMW